MKDYNQIIDEIYQQNGYNLSQILGEETSVVSFDLRDFLNAKQAILQLITEAYDRGYADKAIKSDEELLTKITEARIEELESFYTAVPEATSEWIDQRLSQLKEDK